MRRSLHSLPTDTYWVYDASGALLYVGISRNALTRLESHRSSAPWWPLAKTAKVKRYANRWAASREEAYTIATGSPRFNIVGNSRAVISRREEPECLDEMDFPLAWLRELRRA